MNELGVRYLPLDVPHEQQMRRSAIGPATDPLIVCDAFHQGAKEVSTAVAIRQDSGADACRIEPRNLEQPAAQPRVQHLPLRGGRFQTAESRYDDVEHVRLRPVVCEVSRREKDVIQQRRSRSWAAHDEDGCVRRVAWFCLQV